MKTIYVIGFYSASTNGYLFYCWNKKQRSYLSKNIDEAYKFKSIEFARDEAPIIMKYFWAYPISYAIIKGTLENNKNHAKK